MDGGLLTIATVEKTFEAPVRGDLAQAPPDRLVLVFLATCSLYLLSSSGYIALSDADSMLAVTHSLLAHHDFYVNPSLGVPGVGGHHYSIYGFGWSAAVLPPYLLGMVLQDRVSVTDHGGLPVFFASFLNPVLMAVAAALVYAFVVHLTQSLRRGLIVAAVFALTTPAWPFTKDGFSEPLVLTCLVSATYLLRHGVSLSPFRAASAGALLGLAILTRLDATPEVLVALIYGLAPPERRRQWPAALLVGSVFTAMALYLAYDQIRFGSPLRTGYEYYGYGTRFQRSLLNTGVALGEEVLNPTRGLLWFVPVSLVSAAAFPTFFRRHRSEGLLALSMFLFAWIEHADIFISWQGGWTWGPRFLIPVLPFLCLPLCAIGDSLPWRLGLGLCSLLGFAVNLPAVLVSYTRYFYAVAADPSTTPWPSLFLARSAVQVGRLVLARRVPNGRITELASQGPAAVVSGATSLNAPDFWWFFLIHEQSHVAAVTALAAGLFLAFCILTPLAWRRSSAAAAGARSPASTAARSSGTGA